jgi:hypothetical protein
MACTTLYGEHDIKGTASNWAVSSSGAVELCSAIDPAVDATQIFHRNKQQVSWSKGTVRFIDKSHYFELGYVEQTHIGPLRARYYHSGCACEVSSMQAIGEEHLLLAYGCKENPARHPDKVIIEVYDMHDQKGGPLCALPMPASSEPACRRLLRRTSTVSVPQSNGEFLVFFVQKEDSAAGCCTLSLGDGTKGSASMVLKWYCATDADFSYVGPGERGTPPPGYSNSVLVSPESVAFWPATSVADEDAILVADDDAQVVRISAATGAVEDLCWLSQLSNPQRIVVTHSNHIALMDCGGSDLALLRIYSERRELLFSSAPSQYPFPVDLLFDCQNNLVVVYDQAQPPLFHNRWLDLGPRRSQVCFQVVAITGKVISEKLTLQALAYTLGGVAAITKEGKLYASEVSKPNPELPAKLGIRVWEV